jgi:hypothetical protein
MIAVCQCAERLIDERQGYVSQIHLSEPDGHTSPRPRTLKPSTDPSVAQIAIDLEEAHSKGDMSIC